MQTYYLHKLYRDTRRAFHLFRDHVKLSRQSFDLQRQSLILMQAPQLTIRDVEMRPPPYTTSDPFSVFGPDTTMECRFAVRNTGGSRATILSSAVTLLTIPHSDPLPMISPLAGVTPNEPIIPNAQLKPGEFTFGIFVRKMARDESVSVKDVYVLGWVDFADDLGNVKHINFCRIYIRGRFLAVADPDYESGAGLSER